MTSQIVTSQPLNTSSVEGIPSLPAATPTPSRPSRKPVRRKANWTKATSLLLLKLTVKHRKVIGGKDTAEDVSPSQRIEAWKTIAQEINAAFPEVVRGAKDVERRWWHLKGQGKEELKQYKAIHGPGKKIVQC